MADTDTIGGIAMANAVLIANLVGKLVAKGLITKRDAVDVYDAALLGLETQYGAMVEASTKKQVEIARTLLERALKAYGPAGD